jgi:pSer/pThr/pTyr-binding forkhead associated (FHA) protein
MEGWHIPCSFEVMSTMEMTAVIAPNHAMVLHLKVDQEVHAFDLNETFRVALGRHQSNDIQLRSRRVSSYHAEILSEVDGLFVRDMESTNGTYVNDECVHRKKLRSGDSIRIGEYTLAVLLVPRGEENEAKGAPVERFPMGASGNILPFRGSAPEGSGTGPDATLPDLLGELSRSCRSATIAIGPADREGQEGKLFLREGSIVECELGVARGSKAFYRLLGLQPGTFQIRPLPREDLSRSIQEPTESLIVEGMQQIEALDKLAAKLPPLASDVELDESCAVPVNTLTADELEIYRQLIRHQTLDRTLEASKMTDFMVLLLSHALLQKGFFKMPRTPGREAPLDATVIRPVQSA